MIFVVGVSAAELVPHYEYIECYRDRNSIFNTRALEDTVKIQIIILLNGAQESVLRRMEENIHEQYK